MHNEAVIEGGVLTRGATERSPELLLAEGNRVIRDHKVSRVCSGKRVRWPGGAGTPAGLAAFCVPVEAGKEGGGEAGKQVRTDLGITPSNTMRWCGVASCAAEL